MDNRDNFLEEQIKNSMEKTPDSLRPDNIEQRLLQMTQEERFNRSMSVDIPNDNEVKKLSKSKAAKAKSSKKKVVLPIAIAASVLLAAGVSAYFIFNRESAKSGETTQGLAATSDENSKENNSTENYKKAYRRLKNYKEYTERMYEPMVDYDIVEETAEAEESTSAPRESFKGDTLDTNGATTGATGTTPNFTDTNVRTEGVGEADITKTDGNYIYSYDLYTEHLYIYSVKDGKIDKIGSVNVLSDEDQFDEMYIYEDKLVLLGKVGTYWEGKTSVSVYDISDRTNPKLDKRTVQDGNYESSRMVGNVLYTFSQKNFDLDKMKKRKYETYIPEVDDDVLENGQLIIPDKCACGSYLVATSIDVNTSEIIDKMAVLGGADKYYVSTESIFFIDRDFDWNGYMYNEDSSNIIKISYDEGDFQYKAKGSFPGYLKDDYCVDEYDGYLRLVSTYRDEDYSQYNGLYIYDDELKSVSVIKRLAEGETIRSARFMGDTAYFVTFRNTDPLFAVDLSDPENPRITDYLKIPGFSAYLHPYGDDMLLGIGYDTDESGFQNSVKLSMFDVSDPYDIKEVETKILYDYNSASVLNDRRAFMFNPEDGTFGFSTQADLGYLQDDWYKEYYEEEYEEYSQYVDFDKDGYYYTVFDFDEDEGFETLMDEKLDDMYGSLMDTRGIVIGDYIYIVESGNVITSYDTENYKQFDRCE